MSVSKQMLLGEAKGEYRRNGIIVSSVLAVLGLVVMVTWSLYFLLLMIVCAVGAAVNMNLTKGRIKQMEFELAEGGRRK